MAFTYGTVKKCTTADGSASNVYEVRLGYELQSQDLINNTSVIKLQLQARSTSSSYKPYGYSQTSHIDGIDFGSKTYDFRSTNTWQTFATTNNITVYHNADGTYNVEKSGYFTSSVSGARPKRGDASVNVVLPTIPRASSITVNDANIGSSTSIIINKAIDSFTTTLWYKTIGDNDWIQIVDNTNLQVYGWTVPTSFYQKIPSSKTLYCEFKADTYNGDTYVGTSNVVGATFTATGSPIINSISLVDENSTTVALTGDNSKMIRYASQVRATVNASAQNSASVSSIYVNNQQASNGQVVFYYADTNNYQVVVNDSRGYSTYQTATMTMVDYVPLTLNANIRRNQPTDSKVNINFNGNYFNASFGSQNNTLTVQYRYKESDSSTWGNWTNINTTLSGNTYSGSTQLSDMDYTKSYNFEIQAYDKVQTRSITGITVTKGEPIYWWDNDQFDTNVRTNINNDLEVTGAILANNGVNFLDGNNRFVYWKENGYGDKFGISPAFAGYGDDNKLRIMGAVGDYGTDPGMYDLATISAESGSAWLKGGLSIDGNFKTKRSFLFEFDAIGDGAGRYYKLANIPPDNGSNAVTLSIKGVIGDWVYNKGTIDVQISNRGGLRVYGMMYGSLDTFNSQKIAIYQESDNSHTVYLQCLHDFIGPDILEIKGAGFSSVQPTIYTDYSYTFSPSGNLVYTVDKSNINNVGTKTEGYITANKTSGNGNIIQAYYWACGDVVQIQLVFDTSGGSTSVGSNVWTGTLSNVGLPKGLISGCAFFGSTGYIGSLETNGNLTIRVLGSTSSQSSGDHVLSMTYIRQ